MRKVAIVQNKIIWGGRLDLLAHLIRVLNDNSIIPDIVAFSAPDDFSPETVHSMYGVRTDFKLRILKSQWSNLPRELNIFSFNILLRRIRGDYELLLNSSNTDIFMPRIPTISYVHFPRKARALNRYESIHTFSLQRKSIFRPNGLYYLLLRIIYSFDNKLNPDTRVVCNSMFTRSSFLNSYPEEKKTSAIPVIYPPYSTEEVTNIPRRMKKRQIVHVGRFSPDKFQKELIEFGASKPEFELFLVGFSASDNKYLCECQETLQAAGARNVHLKTNASSSERDLLLKESLIYIHSTPNEPFGLGVLHGIVSGNCLPLVPKSGGQIEIVPFSQLQFTDFEDLKIKLNMLLANDEKLDTLRNDVSARIQKFSYSNFKDQWNSILGDVL